jgi:uncharacterized membrane protein
MGMMIAGLLLFTGIHLMPSLAPGVKQAARKTLGESGYKAVFALAGLAGVALIVFGWRGSVPQYLYMLPPWSRHAGMLLAVLGFLLMGAANYPSRIRLLIRHPQLTGVLLWALAHLVMNGDSRSVLLFGWLAAWSALEIVLISRREGVWIKTEPGSWSREIRGLLISAVVIAVVIYVHPWIAGVPIH